MANPFNVTQSYQDEVVVLVVEGYLDAHTAGAFEDVIQSEIDKGVYKIIVDCESLTYISSAGLGVFMGFVEDVRDHGGDIKICGLIPKVRQVFELLGFQQLYHILDNRDDALRKFVDEPKWGG